MLLKYLKIFCITCVTCVCFWNSVWSSGMGHYSAKQKWVIIQKNLKCIYIMFIKVIDLSINIVHACKKDEIFGETRLRLKIIHFKRMVICINYNLFTWLLDSNSSIIYGKIAVQMHFLSPSKIIEIILFPTRKF